VSDSDSHNIPAKPCEFASTAKAVAAVKAHVKSLAMYQAPNVESTVVLCGPKGEIQRWELNCYTCNKLAGTLIR
jgi:hypothetical protein